MSQNNGKPMPPTAKEMPGEKLSFDTVCILTLGRRELMRLSDDPLNPTPFTINYSEYSYHEAAALVHAIIETMTERHPPNHFHDQEALAQVSNMMLAFATSAQCPF